MYYYVAYNILIIAVCSSLQKEYVEVAICLIFVVYGVLKYQMIISS